MSKPDKRGELRDVDVMAISLVPKAANGERFKVFKANPLAGGGGGEDILPWTGRDLADEGAGGDRGGGLAVVDDRADSDARALYADMGAGGGGETQYGATQSENRSPQSEDERRGALDRAIDALLRALETKAGLERDEAKVRAALDHFRGAAEEILLPLPVWKGEVAQALSAQNKGRRLRDAFNALCGILNLNPWGDGDGSVETDETKTRAALAEFHGIALDALLDGAAVEKAGRKISAPRLSKLKEMHAMLADIIAETDSEGDVSEVSKEEVMKAVRESVGEAVTPISERLLKLEKAEAEPADIGEVMKAAIEEALAPLRERLEKVEKARGFSNRVPEGAPVQKSDDGFWDGAF